jgi:hypothetical protein
MSTVAPTSLVAEVEAWFAAHPDAASISAATAPIVQGIVIAMLEGAQADKDITTIRRGIMSLLLMSPAFVASQGRDPEKSKALAAMLPAMQSYRELLDAHREIVAAAERLIHLVLNTPARVADVPNLNRTLQ